MEKASKKISTMRPYLCIIDVLITLHYRHPTKNPQLEHFLSSHLNFLKDYGCTIANVKVLSLSRSSST